SKMLITMLEQILADSGVQYKDCDAISCTLGPGSFTGIRVGLTAARAIALVANKPLIGLSTLEVIAFAADCEGDMVASIDAYRGENYVQRFNSGKAISEAMSIKKEAIADFAGDAKIVETLPNAEKLARLAAYKWQQGERDFSTSPLYIRPPDAKLPSKKAV
ncbi:MAG: tRNA (adenosine(37)-N6)-threonylcarbamoyltransferase complex dimerization subunit type 1 TsaB, partial [Pseudomonadota bacterium]